MVDRGAVKAEAKQIMRRARVSPYVMTLLVVGIGSVLDLVMDLVQGGSPFYSYDLIWRYYEALAGGSEEVMEALIASIPENTGGSMFLSVIAGLVMLVLNGGYYIYCMGIRRGAEMPYSTLADGLSVAGKLIWCGVQMAVKIVLWSMLFFIPGIVAMYRYRFAYYNILTDDSISAGEAIRRSCAQTRGMKGELFVLDLSFFGWMILSNLTFGLLNIWLTPYMTLCDLGYYEKAREING